MTEEIEVTDELDTDGYPTNVCLQKIAEWSCEDPEGWFDFIYSVWAYHGDGWHTERGICSIFGTPLTQYFLSTCGWSGNESIIRAMQENVMNWLFHWVQSRRGGHYIFEVKDKE